MGVLIEVAGYRIPVETYSFQEDSTPLSASDTSGGTGLLTVTLLDVDPDETGTQDTGMNWIQAYGRNILLDKDVTFTDSQWGTVQGRITSVQQPSPGLIQATASTRLSVLNAYNIQAQPFVGTLGDLLRYYAGLAGIATVTVDSAIDGRAISAPGWTGELWYHLKMLALAEEFEIAFVSGVPEFRRLRDTHLIPGRAISLGGNLPVPTLAQSVEVYQYNNQAITDQLVYPPGGWSNDVTVLNVNAGETEEYTLELSASVSSIQTPVMQTNVAPEYGATSVYTIVANDGLPVLPAMWASRGGSLTVTINEDTRSLTVKLTGATGIPLSTGGEAANFAVALASDTTGSRYSTLRIIGTGVEFNRVLHSFKTGATAQQTATAVGVTVDNPFLSDKNQTFRAGVRAAVDFAGPVPAYETTVIRAVDVTPTLGNVPGARVIDKKTKRPYRTRTANYSRGQISISADDDLLHDDIEGYRMGLTYAQVQSTRNGVTYRDDYLMGLR